MRKVISLIIVFFVGFGFCMTVSAKEVSLGSIASINGEIGGSDKEIIQTDSSNTYKFYYKYTSIDSDSFNKYIEAKYVVDNASENTEVYTTAATQLAEFESTFKGLVQEVKVSDLNEWTLSSDNEISLSNLTYAEGKHNGYVLAVAAVKDGDSDTVYVDRLILESTSSTTLGQIVYTAEDETAYAFDGEEEDIAISSMDEDVQTDDNPNTGVEDYAIYFVVASITIGSAILLKRCYS